jgi:hypothetical protein
MRNSPSAKELVEMTKPVELDNPPRSRGCGAALVDSHRRQLGSELAPDLAAATPRISRSLRPFRSSLNGRHLVGVVLTLEMELGGNQVAVIKRSHRDRLSPRLTHFPAQPQQAQVHCRGAKVGIAGVAMVSSVHGSATATSCQYAL